MLNRDYFCSFVRKKGTAILTRNDVTCKVMGDSTVRIQIFYGVMRALTDIYYVPGLRKSLIFLGQLTSMDAR